MTAFPSPEGITVLGTDITERKRIEEALRESEARRKIAEAVEIERQRLFEVLETVPAMKCLLTHDHHYASTNRAFLGKFTFLQRKKRANGYSQCRTTESESIPNIQKKYLKFLNG